MSTSLFLLFNHELTALQEEEARASLHISSINEPPPGLKAMWRQIPPELGEIDGYLEPIRAWLGREADRGDFVLIQGDFGACFLMVGFAFEHGLVPIYSTTNREAEEAQHENGSVTLTHRFRHRMFRRYGA